jgi:hypothetical protein
VYEVFIANREENTGLNEGQELVALFGLPSSSL